MYSYLMGLRKFVSVTVLILALLFSAMALTPYIRFASAQTSVTINADGSVSPPTSAIQRIGSTYLLTGDIAGITVKMSNIVLDGNGYSLQGEVPVIDSQGHNLKTGNYGGIYLKTTQNVTVKGFSIIYCSVGIYLDQSGNVTISNNTITGTWVPFPMGQTTAGIWIKAGNFITITNNRLENNMYGIVFFENCRNNNIFGNTILGSSNQGIRLYVSSGNAFYHNNFDNKQNIYDSGVDFRQPSSINSWDNGEEGNFWSNYTGFDMNNEGISDTPYKIDSHNEDRFPLMEVWDSSKLIDTEPPRISIISPLNRTYKETAVALDFFTNELTSLTSYSIDGKVNMTITGNITLNGIPNGFHNVTVYITDQGGNAGSSETVYFTIAKEPELFPAVPIAAVSAVALAVVAVLLVYHKRNLVKKV